MYTTYKINKIDIETLHRILRGSRVLLNLKKVPVVQAVSVTGEHPGVMVVDLD